MALDLGELYGTIGIEDRPFQAGIDRAVDYLQAFSGRGVVIAGVAGLAIAGALGASILMGMNIEKANDKLAAQLGLTEAESARIGSVAGSLYADAYGDSLEEVNTAVGAVMTSIEGMNTASSADLEEVTAKALDFATAFEVDVSRAAQVAGQAVSSGLAKDATEAFDLITAASQKVPAALREDILDAADEYGPMFAQLGLSGEQAFGLLVDSSEKGAYGIDKAGDAIKEFTIRSTDMSKASGDAYSAIGLDSQEMANDILAGGDKAKAATQQIVDGLLGIKDPAAQGQAAIALFGTPLEDLGTDQIPGFLESLAGGSDAMEGFGGASERMGDTLNENASTSLTSLKRQAELTFAKLGNWALPIVNDLSAAAANNFGPALSVAGDAMVWLYEASQSAIGFVEDHQTIFGVIAGLILTLLLPAIVAWGVQSTIAAAMVVLAWVTSAAGAVGSAALQIAVLTYVGLRWAWVGIQALLSAAKVAAAWLIAMGPIGLVIAAVIGLVILIVKNWDTIKAKTKAAWDAIVGFVTAFPGKAKAALSALGGIILGVINGAWDRARTGTVNGVDRVVSFVRGLPGKIKSAIGGLGSLLYGVGTDIMDGLLRGIDRGFDWVKDKLSGVGRLIPGWLKKVLGINSPSRVMRDEVGLWIPAGVADGIVAGTPMVEAAAERMAAAMVKAPKAGMAPADMFGGPNSGGYGVAGGGPVIHQTVQSQPGMSEQQVGDAAANAIVFALENG